LKTVTVTGRMQDICLILWTGVLKGAACSNYVLKSHTTEWRSGSIKAQRKVTYRLKAFTAVNIQFEVFWVVTPCSVAVGCQTFGGPFCLHLQDDGSSKVIQNVGILQQHTQKNYEGVSKSFRTGRLEWYIDNLWVSLVSFAVITLCVASQRVFMFVVVYFVIDSVRKLLDTPSYTHTHRTGRILPFSL
jgi:hypothetical protein